MCIINGRTVGDLIGKYTCHEYNGSSTVDYFIIHTDIIDRVLSMRVVDLHWYSDHCPLTVKIGIYNKMSVTENRDTYAEPLKMYKWNEQSKERFIKVLNSLHITDMLNCFSSNDSNDVNELVSQFTDIMLITANSYLKCKSMHKTYS